MIRSLPGGVTVKSLRLHFMLVAMLSLGPLFASAGLVAQNPFRPGPKYRTHFVIDDAQKKTTMPLFTIEGKWHARTGEVKVDLSEPCA
jgi:hypothetical protein